MITLAHELLAFMEWVTHNPVLIGTAFVLFPVSARMTPYPHPLDPRNR